MIRISRYLAAAVLVLAVVSVVLGAVFIYQGIDKADWLREAMRVEKVSFGIDEAALKRGDVIDSQSEAQKAGDTIREHRRGIAPTYQDLLGEGRFDPTNPEQLTYAQALNMENYLYLAVLAFGVTDIAIASGVFMIITGIAFGATGLTLFELAGKVS